MLNNFYIDSLKHIKNLMSLTVQNGKEVQKELITANAIAFSELIRNGVDFSIETPEEEPKQKKSGLTDMFFEEEKEDKPDYICIVIDKVIYRCESTALRAVMHKDYDRYVLKLDVEDDDAETYEGLNDDYIFDLDDMEDDGDEAPKPQVKEEPRPQTVQAPSEEPVNTYHKPVFGYDSSAPDDTLYAKVDNTFLCDEYTYDVNNNGMASKMTIFIYPLHKEMDSLITDVFVVAEMNGSVRANISKGNTLSVTIDFGNVSFIAKGTWQRGEFSSQVNFKNIAVHEVIPVRHRPSVNTSTTYARIPMDGADIYLFPCQFRDNNEKGLCTSAMVLSFAEEFNVLSPNQDGNFVLMGEGGDSRTIETYWEGDTFHYNMF